MSMLVLACSPSSRWRQQHRGRPRKRCRSQPAAPSRPRARGWLSLSPPAQGQWRRSACKSACATHTIPLEFPVFRAVGCAGRRETAGRCAPERALSRPMARGRPRNKSFTSPLVTYPVHNNVRHRPAVSQSHSESSCDALCRRADRWPARLC